MYVWFLDQVYVNNSWTVASTPAVTGLGFAPTIQIIFGTMWQI